MTIRLYSLTGILALTTSAMAVAQATPAAKQTVTTVTATQPATPAQPAIPAQPATPATATDTATPATPAAPAQPAQQPMADESGATTSGTTTTTTATPTANAATAAATKDDIKTGVAVYDAKGGTVGKIESVSAAGAVVATGATRAQLPTASFAKNDKGLVISMTKAELDATAKKEAAKKPAPKKK